MSLKRKKRSGSIHVQLTPRDARRLLRRQMDPDKGGYHSLIRRLQEGVEWHGSQAYLTCSAEDARLAGEWWARVGDRKPGAGGWQSFLPIRSLSPFLPSAAPLFMDQGERADADKTVKAVGAGYYTYAKQVPRTDKIKIGRGNVQRARSTQDTDSPDGYTILLIQQHESYAASVAAERELHDRFRHLRISARREFFWAAAELVSWIDGTRDAQGGTFPPRLRRRQLVVNNSKATEVVSDSGDKLLQFGD